MKSYSPLSAIWFSMVAIGISSFAAEQPVLDENLKPVAKLVGTWNYKWKLADGEILDGTYTCKTAAGGKAIIGRDAIFRKGKIITPSVDIYYWQPETKTIVSAYYGWDGAHNSGTLTHSGDKMVYHVAGYDGRGRFVTGMQSQDWKDNDTFIWQATHSIIAGVPEADSQQCELKRVPESTQETKQPALSSHLKPLAKYLGKWSYEGTTSDGSLFRGIQTQSIDAGGAVLTCEGEETNAGGKVTDSYLVISYWQPETKTIAGFVVDSENGNLSLKVNHKGNKLMWQSYGWNAIGAFCTNLETDEFVSNDLFIVKTSHTISGGEFKAADITIPFKRIKP